MWLASSAAGGNNDSRVLLDFGAMFGPLIANGQYWRLFTAMFVHVGLWHILLNSIALFIFGRMVERFFGHARFLAIYLVAGLSGSVASYLFNSIAVAAGASGAIFGVLGALAAFFVAQRRVFGKMAQQNLYGIALMVVINLWFGLSVPGIDNWAHMGGLAGGFLLGLALAPEYTSFRLPLPGPISVTSTDFGVMAPPLPVGVRDANSLRRRLWVIPLAVLVLAGGTLLATVRLPDNPLTHIYRAERLLDNGDYAGALGEIGHALRLQPFEAEAYYLWGRVQVEQGNIDGARASLASAIRVAQATGDRHTGDQARRLIVELSQY